MFTSICTYIKYCGVHNMEYSNGNHSLWFMYALQPKMVYHPQKQLVHTPAEVGLTYEDVLFATEDNLRLHSWYIPTEKAFATVLYVHGNAGNISGRLQTIQLLNELELNVFIFDYQGYGKSEGHPTEQGTYRDAKAAWDYLVSEKHPDSSQIVIMGRSLADIIHII